MYCSYDQYTRFCTNITTYAHLICGWYPVGNLTKISFPCIKVIIVVDVGLPFNRTQNRIRTFRYFNSANQQLSTCIIRLRKCHYVFTPTSQFFWEVVTSASFVFPHIHRLYCLQ